MIEIEFSVMEGDPGVTNNLLPLLEAFEKQYHIHVNLVAVPWVARRLSLNPVGAQDCCPPTQLPGQFPGLAMLPLSTTGRMPWKKPGSRTPRQHLQRKKAWSRLLKNCKRADMPIPWH